jgi:hypothetical protein
MNFIAYQRYRFEPFCVAGALPRRVVADPVGKVGGDAAVVGAIRAEKQVAVPAGRKIERLCHCHAGSRKIHAPRLTSFARDNISWPEMLVRSNGRACPERCRGKPPPALNRKPLPVRRRTPTLHVPRLTSFARDNISWPEMLVRPNGRACPKRRRGKPPPALNRKPLPVRRRTPTLHAHRLTSFARDNISWPEMLVRSSGFEPPRSCERQPLKLVRLPVPPRPH